MTERRMPLKSGDIVKWKYERGDEMWRVLVCRIAPRSHSWHVITIRCDLRPEEVGESCYMTRAHVRQWDRTYERRSR